jgi:glycosyltransferase involved in cell wall biosynthesis
MDSLSDQIPARSFVPRRLSGLIWLGLNIVSPAAARRYLDHLIRDRMRVARQAVPKTDGPLTLIGAFQLNIGVARAAQILRVGLEAANLPVYPMDCSAVLRPLPGPPQPRSPAPAGGTMVFCVNPPQMTPLLRHFGPRICRGKRLVGYWWWELDRAPREWLAWAALMDEIWVSSCFIQETFARALPDKPVRYVPLAVAEPVASAHGRAAFGLGVDLFTVLVAFDLASHWARKNPLGAIAAFRRAFPAGEAAQLVLKVRGGDQHAEHLGELRAATAGLRNVHILEDSLPAADLAALIRCCDVLLSLHRSEGLGLFIAEAMWLGTPVVATAWSGVLDMLDEENALLVRCRPVAVKPGDYPSVMPGARWAEPDIDHAAECLKRLAADPELRSRLKIKARQRAEHQFSTEQFKAIAPTLLQPPP